MSQCRKKNTGLPQLSSQIEDEIDEIYGNNNDDDMEAMGKEWQIKVSMNISFEMIWREFQK